MKFNNSWKKLMVILGLGAVLSGLPAYSATTVAPPAGTMGPSEWYAQSAQDSDVVTEWNQQAVALTLSPASALAPVQQTRVMAIIHLAVHDAVNGITEKYETYLSPGLAPDNASP